MLLVAGELAVQLVRSGPQAFGARLVVLELLVPWALVLSGHLAG